jgi:hypothetical protein
MSRGTEAILRFLAFFVVALAAMYLIEILFK